MTEVGLPEVGQGPWTLQTCKYCHGKGCYECWDSGVTPVTPSGLEMDWTLCTLENMREGGFKLPKEVALKLTPIREFGTLLRLVLDGMQSLAVVLTMAGSSIVLSDLMIEMPKSEA